MPICQKEEKYIKNVQNFLPCISESMSKVLLSSFPKYKKLLPAFQLRRPWGKAFYTWFSARVKRGGKKSCPNNVCTLQ